MLRFLNWDPEPLKNRACAVQDRVWQAIWADPGELRYAATVAVWGRWFISAVCCFYLLFRPMPMEQALYVTFLLILVLFVMYNGYIHYLLRSNRTMTWHWIIAFCTIDILFATLVVAVDGGFTTFYPYLMYFPALAYFAAIFTSFTLNVVWVTMVTTIYTAVSIAFGGGLDLEAREDKTLFARIAFMFAVVLVVNLVSRFQRMRRWEVMEREHVLQQERIEHSQSIHDTTAQAAYMIGLGIDTAMELAGESNKELTASLQATSALAKSAMWELRRPIDAGRIFEGKELGRVLRSHTSTFRDITSVPAEMVQYGIEPNLSAEIRTGLFAIAHNALTNAFRHAHAGKVEVRLEFDDDYIRLSIEDDGIGLPDDYLDRGHGFDSMRADAERMGGTLVVDTGSNGKGTTVACVIPFE